MKELPRLYEPLLPLGVHTRRNTGMRRGELLGFDWEDVDLEGFILWVRKTLTRIENGRGLALGEPKTKESRPAAPCA